MSHALSLCQYCCQVVVITRLHTLNLTRIHIFLILQEYGVINTVERHIVQHLSRFHHQVLGTHLQVFLTCLQLLHGYYRLTTLLHRQEVNHCRSLELVVIKCLHRHLREESKRSLTTNHRMGYDIERIIVSYKWTKIQTCHILNRVLLTDTVGQFFVSPNLVT